MTDKIFIGILTAWFISQVILKTAIASLKKKRVFLKAGIMGGGMPSSHSAVVTALAAGIGVYEGFHSAFFVISFTLAAYVIYQVLVEKKVAHLFLGILGKKNPDEHIIEELGHSLLEVFVGIAIGAAVVAYLYYY